MNSTSKITLCFITLLLIGCAKEPFSPIDIFEEELISVDEQGNIVESGDNIMLPVGELCDGVQLWANKDRVLELPGGFQIKGTVFANTEEGITTISSGDFEISSNAVRETDAFSGFGSFLMPDVGFFKENIDLADLFGAYIKYGSGAAFKKNDIDLPIVDGDCYFQLSLEESSGFAPGTPSYPAMIGNTALSFNTMYLQPEVPAILIKGDMDQYEKKDKPGKVVDGRDGKKKYKPGSSSIKKKFSIKDVHIGIAAKPHFVFKPNKFSDELEEIVGGTDFEEFQGHLYLKGTVPLKKYPVDIIGEAVVRADYSPLGPMDLFDNSFQSSTYEIGINGTAEFGHAILDFLPLDTRVELGNASLQLNTKLTESSLTIAGEYDTDILGKILGEKLSKILPRSKQSGKLYGHIGTELSEWEYYFESKMSMIIPVIGEQELNKTIIHVTPQQIYLSAFATLPYGIGETEIIGKLNRDGSFLLSGRAEAQLELGDAKLAADLFLEISNEGIILDGMASLPGGISDFKIAGEINAQRMAISGSQMTNIDFGEGARLTTDLQLEASTDTGIRLFGAMETPLDVTKIVVEGEISARGLYLGGLIDNTIDFGVTKLDADLKLAASTWGGAELYGIVDVPLEVIGGKIEVEGKITGITTFSLRAYTGVFIDILIASANANLCFGFSESDIKIGGSVGLCWDGDQDTDEREEKCDGNLGVKINPNWGQGSVSICVEIPILGEHCI